MKDKDHGKHDKPAAKHASVPHAVPAKAKPSAPVTPATCQGNFVAFTAPTMVLEQGGKSTSHAVAASATVTGKASSLTDLKAGDIITLVGDPATEIQVSH